MPGVRDIAENIKVLDNETLTFSTAAAGTISSTAIDTSGYDRGFAYALELDADLGDAVYSYKAEVSDDGSVYTDAPDESYSPSFKQTAAQRILETPVSGVRQLIGVNCGSKHVKLTLTTDTVPSTGAATVTVAPIMMAEVRPDNSWTLTLQPDGGKP